MCQVKLQAGLHRLMHDSPCMAPLTPRHTALTCALNHVSPVSVYDCARPPHALDTLTSACSHTLKTADDACTCTHQPMTHTSLTLSTCTCLLHTSMHPHQLKCACPLEIPLHMYLQVVTYKSDLLQVAVPSFW